VLYVIIGKDVPDSNTARAAARPAHIERVAALQKSGRLILAGPCPAIDATDPGPAGFTGSLIVAEFESLSTAREWAAADPYVTSGVFQSVDVQPFRKVLPL